MTGKLTGQSQANTSYTLTVADALSKNDKEIWDCENLTHAVKALLERQVKEAQIEKLKRLDAQRKTQQASLSAGGDTKSPANHPDKFTPAKPAPKLAAVVRDETDCDFSDVQPLNFDEEESLSHLVDELEVVTALSEKRNSEVFSLDYLRSIYCHGNCLDVLKDMKASGTKIDHIITDPPYGISMKNLEMMSNIDSIEATHDVAQNVAQFEPFLTAAFDLLPDHGFLAMWYDLDHHEKLIALASKVGFKSQRWPLVWCKTSPCLNTTAQFNFTKSTEVCLILRKSSMAILAEKQPNNFIIEPNVNDARHPFAKPFRVWERLVKALSLEGQTILDPFAGSGSSLYSFAALNRLPLGIELDDLHIAEGVELLHKKLNETIKFQTNVQL
jgi:DNA modification methylase